MTRKATRWGSQWLFTSDHSSQSPPTYATHIHEFMKTASILAVYFLLTFRLHSAPVESAPSQQAKYWTASIQAESSKNYPDALKQVEAFIQQGGDAFMGALRSGWLWYISAQYLKAEQAYEKAVRLQPNSVNALLGVLNASRAQAAPKKTEAAASAVLRIQPSSYQALMTLAGLYYATKDYQKASTFYRRTLNHYPDDLDAISGAAWSSLSAGEKKAASKEFARLLSVSPEYPMAQSGFEKANTP